MTSLSPSSDSSNSNVLRITDTQFNVEHLTKLGLTPHHSVEMLLPDISQADSEYPYKKHILHGRFLHITDMHPDEFNIPGAAIRRQCHKVVKSINENDSISHEYGDASSGCDSPMGLYNGTLEWINKNLKDHIDFVIWTGDNIRHDNDRSNPRFESEIFNMNEKCAIDVANTFLDDGDEFLLPSERRVKVIPSLGNNDVYPHNLFAPGPTLQTREMFKIWRDFIPAEQMHTFDRGAYFLKEVIPDKLVVLSINTLYWFSKNPLNDNCDKRNQPGYKLFLWLGAALKECRHRGIKVWLSGHVPPVPKNIHNSCYAKISVWVHEYRDIIIGGVFGHMNVDHWVPLDSVKAWKSIRKRLGVMELKENVKQLESEAYNWMNNIDWESEDSVEDLYKELGLLNALDDNFLNFEKLPFTHTLAKFENNLKNSNQVEINQNSDRYWSMPGGKVSYLEEIRDSIYAKLKSEKKSGEHFDRYGIAHISASVIPTFNPGIRVWEYNVELLNQDITKENNIGWMKKCWNWFTRSQKSIREGSPSSYQPWNSFFETLEKDLQNEDKIEKLVLELEQELSDFNDLHIADESQIMSKQKQLQSWYALGSDKTIPNPMPENLDLGPAYILQALSPQRYTQYNIDLNEVNYGDKSDHWEFKYDVQYSTDNEPYNMESLLVKDWISLGRKMAKTAPDDAFKKKRTNPIPGLKKANKIWSTFINRAFIGSNYEDLEDSRD